MAGDVIDVTDAEGHEEMLRVVAVHEDRVWFKQYGAGHALVSLAAWKKRLSESPCIKIIRGADHDNPF